MSFKRIMSDYCNAGKCECEHFDGKFCCAVIGIKYTLFETIEVCPWPSRQVRKNNLSKIFGAIPDMPEYVKQNPYATGRLDGLHEAKEAVKELIANDQECDIIEHNMAINEAITAIDRLMDK